MDSETQILMHENQDQDLVSQITDAWESTAAPPSKNIGKGEQEPPCRIPTLLTPQNKKRILEDKLEGMENLENINPNKRISLLSLGSWRWLIVA